MRVLLLALALVAFSAPAAWARPSAAEPRPVRLIFGGDVMLGRGVARADPSQLFAGIRGTLAAADYAVANLESPLTTRKHLHGPYALEAPPSSARLLREAGLDAVGLANNHAGDAGPGTVPDTARAVSAAGVLVLGAGPNAAAAYAPRVVRVGGIRIALLDIDATRAGPPAGAHSWGIASWNEALARGAVLQARREADVVVVGLHSGTEYLTTTDPYTWQLAQQLARWGADIVWAAHPHVVQPVRTIHNGSRTTVVATSLGNLVFDQHQTGTRQGALLEVLAGKGGVRAYRVGAATAYPPVRFLHWQLPRGDAVAVARGWWQIVRPVQPVVPQRAPSLSRFPGTVLAASVGDAEASGTRQLVVAFRRPYRPTNISAYVPRSALVDRHGLTAHVGVYRLGDLAPLWVAGTLLRPVSAVAACRGAVAVTYTELNSPRVVGTGAWLWSGFGFSSLPMLPGLGTPACANVDGVLDPVVLGRSKR